MLGIRVRAKYATTGLSQCSGPGLGLKAENDFQKLKLYKWFELIPNQETQIFICICNKTVLGGEVGIILFYFLKKKKKKSYNSSIFPLQRRLFLVGEKHLQIMKTRRGRLSGGRNSLLAVGPFRLIYIGRGLVDWLNSTIILE